MFKQTKFKVFLFLAVLLGGLPVNMLAQQKASHLEKKVNLPPNTQLKGPWLMGYII